VSVAPEEFRYPVAPMVQATLTLAEGRLHFRQGLRTVVLAYADITAFGYRDRGPAVAGISSSELLFAHRKGAAIRRTALPFDRDHPACQAALAALRRAMPQADTTELPWTDAAARLGVPARRWYEPFLHPRAALGVVLIGAAAATSAVLGTQAASSSERLGQGIAVLACWLAGITLIVQGVRRAKKK
jgi:hypothetical protein